MAGLVGAAILAAAAPAMAGSGGAEPFSFLFLDANARAVGMGGAYTALAKDANALLYNPGALGRVGLHEATFMHNQYFEGISQEYLAYGGPHGFGASLNYLSFGNAQRTTIANPTGAGLGMVDVSDLALAVGHGRSWKSLGYGAGFKFIRESLAGYSAQGFALDLGALYTVGEIPGLDAGLSLQNIGPPVKFQSARESLPLNFRTGAAYSFRLKEQACATALDISKELSEPPVFGLGLETVVLGAMPVRLGFNTRNSAGPGISAGVGWLRGPLAVDYAFAPYGDLGSAHRISLTWKWGKTTQANPCGSGSGGAPAHRCPAAGWD